MFDILAIDWGEKYFGIAFGSRLTKLVIPATQFILANQAADYLKNQIQARKITTIILGYPTTFHGKNTKISHLIQEYKTHLEQEFKNIKVELIDERGTSKTSQEMVNNSILSHNLAAVVILERWLEKTGV